MNNLVAITIGDINGVGIEILIAAWKKKKINKFILFSNYNIIKKYLDKKKLKNILNIIEIKNDYLNYDNKKINIYSFRSNSLEENTYKSLKYAYEFCKKKICIGIITLPLRKDLIKKNINKNFIGQTEYFQKLDKKLYSNMILFHNKFIISTLTTHIEIKKISRKITNKKFLYNQIINLNNTLKIDFNIKKPRIIVSGLNPHAGENGEIGLEEVNIIKPIIKKLNNNGINIDGPLSADSLLIKKNFLIYDCFIFMFHDQALIPFKLMSQFTGVNYTGNLSIIRTSPDHGTAYNLVGSKKISTRSFINCYKLIKKIYKNRMINVKS